MDTGRKFTAKEIAECAQEALENWDFDVMLDNGDSPEYVKAYKQFLEIDEGYAQDTWCSDGPMYLDSAYGDIWDFLDEFAANMAGQKIW